MQKTLTFLAAFFAVLLLREKRKKPFVSITFFFCICYILKTKRKPVEQKYKEMFSYQFVAHMPKIKQI